MMSDERYRGKLLDLAVRVISTYIDVAYSKDQITLTESQKTTYIMYFFGSKPRYVAIKS